MTRINWRRVWFGAVGGFVVWAVWSAVCEMVVLAGRYPQAQTKGVFVADPRYPFFVPAWFATLFVLAFILAWLYAAARNTLGAGPRTAVLLGVGVGFATGFPIDFALAAWLAASRVFPLWWMIELWAGAILASVVAGWLYRD
jgi:hypothetical protein